MRLALLSILVLLSIVTSAAHSQQDAESAADSLIRNDESLFGTPPDSAIGGEERLGQRGRLPSAHDPLFSFALGRQDLLGLQDRLGFSIFAATLKYNRADGLFLGYGRDTPLRLFLTRRTEAYLGLGYALGSHYWQFLGGLHHDLLGRDAPLRLLLEGHIYTDTQDAWKMDIAENSLASAIAGADARDYYQRQGFSVGVQKFLNERLRLGGEFRRDKYLDAHRESGWSLFGPKQPFREVPAIREGAISSVVVNFLADYITFRTWTDPQFGIELQGEFGLGDQSFAQYVADARLKMAVVPGRVWLAVRGRMGSATGDAPPQKLFTIGGTGTLPGYPQNEYGGNRMLLLQTDLLIAPIESANLRLILSNDFGGVASTSTTSGLLGGFPGDVAAFKYSPGVYLGTPTGWIRIGAAWRTDISAPPRFVMRLAKPF